MAGDDRSPYELLTLAQVSNMHFDCETIACVREAKVWQTFCKHDLLICHQEIAPGNYQLVMRHGNGEAVFVIPTSGTIEYYRAEAVKWIDRVHAYERV